MECLVVVQNTTDCKVFIENFVKLFTKTELEMKQKLSVYCGKLVVFIKESKTIYKGVWNNSNLVSNLNTVILNLIRIREKLYD